MSEQKPKRMDDFEFGARWDDRADDDLRLLRADHERARASEKRLADMLKAVSFLVNQLIAASREGDFGQVIDGLGVIRAHLRAALSEVEG